MTFDEQCKNKLEKLENWNKQKKQLAVEEIQRARERINGFPLQKRIYWVSFGENVGFELSSKHPALVVSANHYNKTGTVIVAPITSGKIRRDRNILQCQYELFESKYGALDKDCLIKLDQLRTVSVSRVLNEICYVSQADWKRIVLRLKKTFAIK